MSRLKDLFKKSTNESAKTEEINEAQFGPSVGKMSKMRRTAL